LQPKGVELFTIPGMPPDLSKPISGCAFAARCAAATARCTGADPVLTEMSPGHAQACLRVAAGEL